MAFVVSSWRYNSSSRPAEREVHPKVVCAGKFAPLESSDTKNFSKNFVHVLVFLRSFGYKARARGRGGGH